jgi:hypothetical protein
MDAWSYYKTFAGTGTVYGGPLQDVCYAMSTFTGSSKERVFYANTEALTQFDGSGDPQQTIYGSDFLPYVDADQNIALYYPRYTYTTGWIHMGSPQDRSILSDVIVLTNTLAGSGSQLKMYAAWNYVPTYTSPTAANWTFNPGINQVELQLPRNAVMSASIKIESGGTGIAAFNAGPELLAVTVKGGLQGGGQKLANASKG